MKRQSLQLVVLFSLLYVSTAASALEDQWFAGIGGGTSWLVPNPVDSSIDDSENTGSYGTFYIGRDLGNFSSFQIQFHSLGTAILTNQQEVDYSAFDASILYRFYDSRDSGFDRDAFGIAVYGRFGLGGMKRDTPAGLPLKNDADVYFAGGAGVEFYFNRWLALRLEVAYLDQDAAFGGISLLTRFGGNSARPPVFNKADLSAEKSEPVVPAPTVPKPDSQIPTQSPSQSTSQTPSQSSSQSTSQIPSQSGSQSGSQSTSQIPSQSGSQSGMQTSSQSSRKTLENGSEVAEETGSEQGSSTNPETTIAPGQELPTIHAGETDPNGDSDDDHVPDNVDECADSRRGYPVKENGCAMLNGVLNGVAFAAGSANLLPASFRQLDSLASLLKKYPQARIQVLAHTDNLGLARDKSILTRARLRTLGTYLVRKGLRANRLILRSLGGSRPAFDNTTEEGRASNNRIELLEYR